ncbi:2,4-dienoyl-CoA reductase-like NADH-dependent reductase (Old Yellow Enzyme family) [Glaciihabitans tibetensis]|uniref:2,4-dienoyl-CoA reductase-like NADH-dependent reductase (Old Yellow Enzyme family) n=1 Tax=Glaciihabitans tibetensis TaxID=1266600 RepID=A0A2T0VIF3_9MICO|nr:NADH:flavin oxidoreductase/NADH oxidase [Glaciihabitans tibetensis]PRY70010.1 2,4-dienoyl-CoA reductase-like NADH-dependent reductase (Old Yellow Enzyme family) [Glaciihabitans tibetensis]
MTTPPTLFTPFDVRGVSVRNRIWVAPMCQYSAEAGDGMTTDWHLVHLGSFATGGAGMVMTEAAAVSPEGRISPQDLGIWNDEQAAAFARITTFLHAQGATTAIQLAHAGRKGSTYRPFAPQRGTVPAQEGGWPTVGPSAVEFPGYAPPRELAIDEIDGVVDDFVAAALRAVRSGFDVLELHAAHGYLIHQFLSPLSNQRSDEYGGSLENRARLLLRIVTEVRAAVGDSVPLFVRFSATDWTENGWDEHQTSTVANWAEQAGADVFDISTGGNVAGVTIPLSPGYQVPFAEFVKGTAAVRVNAVGLITSAEQANQIVASGQSDAVMLGREMLRDPHFALRAAQELGVEVSYWPAQYVRAKL